MSQKIKVAALALALLLITGRSHSSEPVAENDLALQTLSDGVVMVFDEYGHEVPFPRNSAIMFPWEFVEGYWAANIGEVAGIFGFKIDVKDPTRRRLEVTYLERETSRILAQGYGTTDDEGKTVHAYIQGPGLEASIYVTAYKLSVQGVAKTRLVTTIQTKDNLGNSNNNNYVVQKIR